MEAQTYSVGEERIGPFARVRHRDKVSASKHTSPTQLFKTTKSTTL
uniref:Uncharacterized protein n=1 Tax=Anguilla anguilla TaxID=7936 RepID=A0A0E9WD27_ANGAN